MLIRSVSGVRGYVNSHFTPEISINYARALNEMLPRGRNHGDIEIAGHQVSLL